MMSISPLCLALKPLNNGLTCFLLINTFMLATSAPGTEQTALLDMIIETITKCTRQLKSVLYNQLRLVVILVV